MWGELDAPTEQILFSTFSSTIPFPFALVCFVCLIFLKRRLIHFHSPTLNGFVIVTEHTTSQCPYLKKLVFLINCEWDTQPSLCGTSGLSLTSPAVFYFQMGSCYVGQLSPELMSLLLWSLLKPRSQACAAKSSK